MSNQNFSCDQRHDFQFKMRLAVEPTGELTALPRSPYSCSRRHLLERRNVDNSSTNNSQLDISYQLFCWIKSVILNILLFLLRVIVWVKYST